MKRRASQRLAVLVAAPLITVGIIVGAGEAIRAETALAQFSYLADYGANETAEIGQERARDAGVRHNTDAQHGTPGKDGGPVDRDGM